MRLFRTVSLFLGAPILAALLLGVSVIGARMIWVEVSGPAVDEARYLAKQAYLSSVQSVSEDAPNIVIVFFDDLGWGDLSSYGNTLIKTPHMDEIAAQGMKMTDFYSASPVCTPARAALLTGRYPPRTKTDRHVFFPDHSPVGMARRVMGLANELPKEEVTLSETLQKAGYDTALVGKWHLGDHEGYRPNDFGFEYFYGVLFSNDMHPFHLYENTQVVVEDQRQAGFFPAERDELNPLPGEGVDQTTLTDKYTDQAIAYMSRRRDKPFFLYFAHSFPHVPHYASPAFAGMSEAGTYGDVVEDLDRSTGRLLAAIERLDSERDTILIITSDNGADYGGSVGSLRGRKQEILEGGQRVPMIIHWPGKVEPGQVSSEMAMSTDLFPTLLGIVGVDLPKDRVIDGKDLAGLWMQSAPSPHEYLYYFPTLNASPGAVRDDTFKLLDKMDDLGRNREHLSLMIDNESHDVQTLYPDDLSRLQEALATKQQEVANNPRGWLAAP